VLTVEAILILSILLLATIGIIEFGILISMNHTVTLAATQGAREAGAGADIADLTAIVNEKLAPHGIVIGTDAAVRLEDPSTSTDVTAGSLTCTPLPTTPPIQNGDIRVTVCVSMSSLPLMGQLDDFGFSLLNCLLKRSAVVKRERAPFP